ncbi:MAG TPA: hypothetical protein VFG55_01340 [Rhodanobacteraceae bacterium]|nr:hypothetical protein [Rhodanobacteraceae bacterium]
MAITNFGRYKYVSAQFSVPANPPFDSGRIARGDSLDTVALTSASISESCGDFSSAVPDQCRISGAHQASMMLQWSIDSVVPGTCPLTTGHTYYLNLMMAPIGGGAWYCSGATCQLSVVPYGL